MNSTSKSRSARLQKGWRRVVGLAAVLSVLAMEGGGTRASGSEVGSPDRSPKSRETARAQGGASLRGNTSNTFLMPTWGEATSKVRSGDNRLGRVRSSMSGSVL